MFSEVSPNEVNMQKEFEIEPGIIISKLNIKDGDTLIITVDTDIWDLDAASRMVNLFSKIFPWNNIICKFKGFDITPTNSDRVIGKTGEVIKRIGKNNYGEVKIFGNTWTATSKEELEVGDKVKVLNIEGVKLIVEKEEN